MGKFMEPIKAPKKHAGEERPEPPQVCMACGWKFGEGQDNDRERGYDDTDDSRRRREPRTQIAIGVLDGVLRYECTPCYESRLWRAGKHTKQGHEGAQTYRQGIIDQLECTRGRPKTAAASSQTVRSPQSLEPLWAECAKKIGLPREWKLPPEES